MYIRETRAREGEILPNDFYSEFSSPEPFF